VFLGFVAVCSGWSECLASLWCFGEMVVFVDFWLLLVVFGVFYCILVFLGVFLDFSSCLGLV